MPSQSGFCILRTAAVLMSDAQMVSADSITRQTDPMSTWNFRVVQSADDGEYFIAEVYYDGSAMSWVENSRDCLRWTDYADLKSTVELIRQAFDKPLLRVTADERLVEVPPA